MYGRTLGVSAYPDDLHEIEAAVGHDAAVALVEGLGAVIERAPVFVVPPNPKRRLPDAGTTRALLNETAQPWHSLLNAHLYPGAALNDVVDERGRQNHKWGEQNHPNGTGPTATVLDGGPAHQPVRWIEAGALRDYLRAATNFRANQAKVAWADILLEEVFEALAESDPATLRAELVQVAAVAVQWVEAIDRKAST